MDYNKLRYDLALQAATARLIMHGSDGSSKNTSKELLEIFAVCYDDAKQIPDIDFKKLFSHD
ncbi:MAG: hypothetical protein HFH87_09235 [Lachnospiraceae bacterium]|nr:hypothetical protein [Lachnospiraceae bacterium]